MFALELECGDMEVVSADKRLGECLEHPELFAKVYGPLRAKLICRRLDSIRMADNLAQLKGFPGRFHELTGNRKGQWACDLDQPYRLILEQEGEYVVTLIEITDYHGK